jgi:hypothetical protein
MFLGSRHRDWNLVTSVENSVTVAIGGYREQSGEKRVMGYSRIALVID